MQQLNVIRNFVSIPSNSSFVNFLQVELHFIPALGCALGPNILKEEDL